MRSAIVSAGSKSGATAAPGQRIDPAAAETATAEAAAEAATAEAAAETAAETAAEAADFEGVRSRLFGIAYQMLGRVADAEDVVQDVWIRWQGADRARVHDRVAFLVTVTTRVAINAVTSARVRREVSVGVGLPERDYAAADPAVEAERGEELGRAVHLLIKRLSAVERAVYVLREGFGYSFREIADVLEISEANARQLGHRARIRLGGERDDPVDPKVRDGLLKAFLDAARAGDMARLIEVLANARTPG